MRTATNVEPIAATWKISQVLARYPELLETLIDMTPAFGRLRNPVLRKVQTRLVTVEQAARIAGLEPADLVQRLNAAIGATTPAATTPAVAVDLSTITPAWVDRAPVAAELDARPFQARGEEPFSAIMAAVREVPAGQVLRLRNSFEPVPLYDVLHKRGFEAWPRRLAENDWEILFYNTGTPQRAARAVQPAAAVAPSAPVAPAAAQPAATITIDVSELVPPEPMIKILSALEELKPGSTLLVHHVRRPMHLYPRLDALGYAYETHEPAPGQVEVVITKPAEASL